MSHLRAHLNRYLIATSVVLASLLVLATAPARAQEAPSCQPTTDPNLTSSVTSISVTKGKTNTFSVSYKASSDPTPGGATSNSKTDTSSTPTAAVQNTDIASIGAATGSNPWTFTVTAQEVGSTCIVVEDGTSQINIQVTVTRRNFVLSYGGMFNYDSQVRTWGVVPSSATIGPPPSPMPSPGSTVNRVEQTAYAPNSSAFVAVANFRIHPYSSNSSWWVTVGSGINNGGLLLGISNSLGGDEAFFTVGVHESTTQDLLPGYKSSQIVPTGATIAQNTSQIKFFFGITADSSLLGCVVSLFQSTGCTASK